ncbi:hypothetical protein LTR85_001800 [Meristemomyces frigidus]|nr:hypothetical protein LTR85_001800 [Meristemomyces frigidus]
MVGVRQQLAHEFNLGTQKQPKPIVRAEDEFELLKTLWSSPSLTFDHERMRVQLALIAQLAGITGNRPGALLGLLYKHLKVTLLRDPDGSAWPKVLLEFTFKSTKSYRGPKESNTFPIPELCSESCLPLCPQTVLLSLVFADKAFASPSLTGPERLFQLRIPSYLNQLELPIRESIGEIPIFRTIEHTAHGNVVSRDSGATSQWLRDQFKRWGEITGFELPLKPYGFRRGNGEALDSSAYISDAQRNVILQHASSRVFESNYLSRYITQDTQAAYRGLAPQTALVRAASGMTRTMDARQPRHLDAKQMAEVDRHPEVHLLRRTRDSLAKRIREIHRTITRAKGTKLHETYQGVLKEHGKKRKAISKTLLKHVKARYRKQQALADIERQLCGSSLVPEDSPEATDEPVRSSLSEERQAALITLFCPASPDPAEERERRSAAIDAVTILCGRQEPGVRKACRPKRPKPSPTDSQANSGPENQCQLFPLACAPTQCIFCLGNVALALDLRLKEFRDCYSLSKHFAHTHLGRLPDGVPIACPHPECDAKLRHKQELQKHALVVHKTRT